MTARNLKKRPLEGGQPVKCEVAWVAKKPKAASGVITAHGKIVFAPTAPKTVPLTVAKEVKSESISKTVTIRPWSWQDLREVEATDEEIREWTEKIKAKYPKWIPETPLSLERLHPHERDKYILFVDPDGAHLYIVYPWLAPHPLSMSTTALKKYVVKETDWDEQANRCVRSPKWSICVRGSAVSAVWAARRKASTVRGSGFHRRVEGFLNKWACEQFGVEPTPEEAKIYHEIETEFTEEWHQKVTEKYDNICRQIIFLARKGLDTMFDENKDQLFIVDDCSLVPIDPMEDFDSWRNIVLPKHKWEAPAVAPGYTPHPTYVLPTDMVEFGHFVEFWLTIPDQFFGPEFYWKLWRTEIRFWLKRLVLSGSSDCFVDLEPKPSFVMPKEWVGAFLKAIFDWKLSKGITYSGFDGEMMTAPFDDQTASDMGAHTLQQNSYQYFAEETLKVDGKRVLVVRRAVVVCHRSYPKALWEPLKDIQPQMRRFMEDREHIVQAMLAPDRERRCADLMAS